MPTVYLSPGPFGAGGQFFTVGGLPLNLGQIFTYAAGTTTPTATYTTSAGTILNSNPVILSADGRLGEIWLVAGTSYRIDIKDSLGNLLATFDNLAGIIDPSALLASNVTFNGNITFSGTNVFNGNNSFTGNISVIDGSFTIIDNLDATKKIAFQASGIPASTVATLNVAAANIVEGVSGTAIASATTINLDTATGDYISITGTTTTTGMTLTQGRERTLVAAAAWPVTASATLIMTGIIASGSTYTFAAGDVIKVRGEASGVRVVGVDFAAAPAAQGSSMVLLSTQTAAISPALQFTTGISSTYDEYVFVYAGIVPATNNVNFVMNMSINGGSSYDSGATSYSYANTASGANTTNYGGGSTGTTGIVLTGATNGIGNTSTSAGVNGESRLFRPSSVTDIKHVKTNLSYSGSVALATLDGAAAGISASISGNAVNAVNFQMSTGNITSGTIRMYGIRKS